MAGEPAERAGLLVGLPVPFVVGTALEGLARACHFLVVLGKQRLSD